jgi:hypothetical protein
MGKGWKKDGETWQDYEEKREGKHGRKRKIKRFHLGTNKREGAPPHRA